MIDTIFNCIAIILAIWLLIVCATRIRGANGSQPLFIGVTFSALFGAYIVSVRAFDLPLFNGLIVLYLASKLWSIYAAATGSKTPLITTIKRWRAR